jgi:signal recognition particle subunit SRP54
LVWFPAANAPQATVGSVTTPDFTLNDFRKQLVQMKRIAVSREGLVGTRGEATEPDLRRIQGILDAMTNEERGSPDILDQLRCRRIAAGSGVSPQVVERFLAQFRQVRLLMRRLAHINVWDAGGV